MAYNKFIKKDGTVMLDLTDTTVSAETLAKDIVAVDKYGNKITGTMEGVKDLPMYESLPVTVSSGLRYYYNRKDLPEIPKYVLEDYTYICILVGKEGYALLASAEKGYITDIVTQGLRLRFSKGYLELLTENDISEEWYVRTGNAYLPTRYYYFTLRGSTGWTVWWSNYNIPKDSPEGTEIYFPASLPTAELPADATHFYYNGVRLPKIPDEVTQNYTHYWIYREVTRGYYRLICSNSVWYVGGDPIAIRDTMSVDDPRYNITDEELASGGTWSAISAGNYYYGYNEGERFPLWSAQNILDGSSTSSDVFLSSTPAVPDPTE